MEGWINLYTVHDAIPLDRPDLTPIDPRRHRAVLDAIVTRGDRITTVSQNARTAIVTTLGCDPGFVVDIGQPVSVAETPTGGGTEAEAVPLPAGLTTGGYLLMVGSVEPRKNLTVVLDAYRRAGIILPLVVAGPDGWRAGPILADIAATPGVVRLPYVDRDTLLALIRYARALVFPSLAEGFGLPVAEAMALGTPVLTSDRGALAEIAGGAALTVDPTDVGAIGNALTTLISDTAMATALSRAGLVRAAAFSPDRFAERLERVYRDALRVGGHEGNGSACHGQRR
jgi:glycosyltransferase involved in cell wall biosynthesis